jgi:hypothetical protein
MLVDTDDTAIDKVEGPVELPGGIGAGVEGGQDAVPDASALPAAEAAVDGLPGAIVGGEIPPGGTGGQAPEEGVEDAAMVKVGAPSSRFGRWKQGRQLLPLVVSESMTLHAVMVSQTSRFANTP